MTLDFAAAAIGLILVLALDGLLSAARAALMNCHAPSLRSMQASGVSGASRALGLASEATNLLISFGAFQTLLRLTALALAVAVWMTWAGAAVSLVGGVGVVFAVGILAPLVELLGESLALRSPERTACRLSLVGAGVVLAAAPVRWIYRRLARRPGGRHAGVVPPLVTEEEIKTIVDAGEEGGAIEVEEKKMIFSIFELGETLVREVMVPRMDICAFEDTQTLEEVADALLAAGHSRAPVYREDIDRIIGIVYVRDLLRAFREGRHHETVASLLRPALFVPEAKKADDLLADLQARRIHMAVVVDEYGGTAGLVTLEDLVEEIVGEIRDEYDAVEDVAFQELREGEFLFTGRIDLDEVNELTGARLPKDIGETLGGFISGHLGRVPSAGDIVDAGGLHLVVEQSSGRRILNVRASRIPDTQESDET